MTLASRRITQRLVEVRLSSELVFKLRHYTLSAAKKQKVTAET